MRQLELRWLRPWAGVRALVVTASWQGVIANIVNLMGSGIPEKLGPRAHL